MKTTHIRNNCLRRKSGGGFTRFEVVAIISCLVAVGCLAFSWRGQMKDLSALTLCENNLRNLGTGLSKYVVENHEFPAVSGRGSPRDEDWIHWQANRLLEESVIANYTASFDGRVLRCPQDGDYPYREYAYSYSMNAHIEKVNRSFVLNPESLCIFYEEEKPNDGACVPEASADRLSQRHRGKSQTAFLDGRVETISVAAGKAVRHARPILKETQ